MMQRTLFTQTSEISIMKYAISIGLAILIFSIITLIKRCARKTIKKKLKASSKRKELLSLISNISRISSLIFGLFFASLNLPFSQALRICFAILFVVAMLVEIRGFVAYFLEIIMSKIFSHQDEKTQKNLTEITNTILQVLIWIFTILIVFDVIGIQLTPLLASLGVGGIAVAFAAQKLLEDFFSSFSIMGSSPFRIGDIITVNTFTGTVKQIWLRATTIQTVEGKSIVMPNRILISNIIENSGMIKNRRKRFSLTLTYQTPVAVLRTVPTILEKIIAKHEKVAFERGILRELQASSLEILVSYVVESDDRLYAAKIHDEILLDILETFEKEGIEFAYPTQTLYLKQEN